jgi:hypothetical protein
MQSCVDLVNMPVDCGAHPSINAAMPRASIRLAHTTRSARYKLLPLTMPILLSGNVDLPYWATLFCMGQQAYPLIVFRH